MLTPRLFCLDTVLVDVELTVSGLPERAGDVRASSQLIATGGGFNAMSAAARQDLDVVYAGRLGVGPFASLASNSLAAEGIVAPLESNRDLDSGVCVVLVEPDAERTFVTASGAEGTLRASDLARLEVTDADVVLVSGYNVMYPDTDAVVLEWVERLPNGAVVAFDPATRVGDIPPSNLGRLMARVTWLLCNRDEATQLTGRDDAFAAAQFLASDKGAFNVVVRCGRDGCVVALKNERPVVVDGFAAGDAVDTTGAGDTHNGVFLALLAQGRDPVTAAQWANAAAAISVTRAGPATSPRRSEVEAFVASGETMP